MDLISRWYGESKKTIGIIATFVLGMFTDLIPKLVSSLHTLILSINWETDREASIVENYKSNSEFEPNKSENEPKLFSQQELNDLVRDLGLKRCYSVTWFSVEKQQLIEKRHIFSVASTSWSRFCSLLFTRWQPCLLSRLSWINEPI